jgi:hypothetical protein
VLPPAAMPFPDRHFAATVLAVAMLSLAPLSSTQAQTTRDQPALPTVKEACNGLQGNAYDVCEAETEGHRRIAQAQAKVAARGSPKNHHELAEVRAKVKYEVDRYRCNDLVGDAKDLCQREAKAVRDLALVLAEKQALQSTAQGTTPPDGASPPMQPSSQAAPPATPTVTVPTPTQRN